MSNFCEDFGLNQYIKKPIQPMLCICCLKRNVPFISLISCTHSTFLNNFVNSEIKPDYQLICYQCHHMLKKIKQFKMLVEDSFKLLKAQVNNTESIRHQQINLTFHKIIDINIPEPDSNQDEQTNSETENSFENITCTTTNNFENINKEENNFENKTIEKETNFGNIKCYTDNKSDIIKEQNNYENNSEYIKETNKELTSNTEINLKNIIKNQNNIQNITCHHKEDIVENVVNNDNNIGSTDIHINDLTEATPINKIINKKLKNIKTALSIINKNGSNANDVINLLGTSPHNIVSNLTSILQGTDVLNVFDWITERTEDVIDHVPMQIGENAENAATKNFTSEFIEIALTTLTKEEVIIERNTTAKSKIYLESPHRCEGCLMGFQFKDNFDDHIKRRHTAIPGSVTCDICQQELPHDKYDGHRFRHFTRYRCVPCCKQFSLYDELVEHYEMEHPATTFKWQQNSTHTINNELLQDCNVERSCIDTPTHEGKRSLQDSDSPTEKRIKRTEIKINKCMDYNKVM